MQAHSQLHAAYLADRALQESVVVIENVKLAEATFRVRFAAPEMARRFFPGQFLMLKLAGQNDPLLGRPFALYDTVLNADGAPCALDVVYLAQGKLTSRLAQFRAGERLEVWGPLGNGFAAPPTEHLVMVAGGIGQTPFLALAREARGFRSYGSPARAVATVPKITLCYGARSARYFAGVEDFQSLGLEVRLSTDDGSRGHHGLVTDLLRETLATGGPGTRVVCCGPEKMMASAAAVSREAGVPCQVSLETPMACGIGICFTCVAKVREGNGHWDYKRTCVEGPVFDAAAIEW